MEKTISIERAMKNAFASARMEGFCITREIERNCSRLLNREATIDDCVKEMLAKPAQARAD